MKRSLQRSFSLEFFHLKPAAADLAGKALKYTTARGVISPARGALLIAQQFVGFGEVEALIEIFIIVRGVINRFPAFGS